MGTQAQSRTPSIEVVWEPSPRQAAFIEAEPIFEVLFGGARGGGKTDGVLGEWLSHADKYGQNAIGLMVRRTYKQLTETMERSRAIYTPLGAKLVDDTWRFPNGARLRFAYLERDADAENYQGASFTRIYVEEITNFPSEKLILKLMATLRSGAGVPCGFRATGNPGGVGHHWVKARYINPAPLGWKVQKYAFTNPKTGITIEKDRVFIPSKVEDNPHLGDDYIANLQMQGSPQLVKAWLEGDWSVIEGAFFPEWSNEKHVIAPFAIPSHWLRFRSMDWGSASPFSVGWWAVVSDDYAIASVSEGAGRYQEMGSAQALHRLGDGSGRILPRGSLIRYREWYGASAPNVGIKMPAEEVARGILQKERGDTVSYGVLDPAAFASDGGPSIGERMRRNGVLFRAADNKRVAQRGALGGWDQVRSRLIGQEGRPSIYFFSTCTEAIRTLPALQHDPDKPEDVDCWVEGTLVNTYGGSLAIELIGRGTLVETPLGYRPVLKSYYSGMSSTIKLTLSNGIVIEGTPHHKIYVEGKGLVALENVECYDVLIERNTWPERLLNIAVSSTRGIKVAGTTIQMAQSYPMAAQAFIAKYGWMRAAQFLRASISTTLMAIWITTRLKISSVLVPQNIYATIGNLAPIWGKGEQNGHVHTKACKRLEKMHARCLSAPQDVNKRAEVVESLLRLNTLRRFIAPLNVLLQQVGSNWKRLVRFAGLASGLDGQRKKKSAPVHIVAVGRSEERKRVYNLTVAEAHLFYVGGVLSSNTDSEDHAPDEIRYACMSRPYVREKPQDKPVRILGIGPHNQVTLEDMWNSQPRKKSQRI